MTAERTCDLPPFLSPVVAQVRSLEDAGSALEILTQTLESYIASFKAAICDDLTQIVEECCNPAGATTFLELDDTPNSYAGAGGELVAVNIAETGLEFITLSFLGLNDTPDSYTGDAGDYVAVNATEDGLEFITPPVIPPATPDRSVEKLIWFAVQLGPSLVTANNSYLGYGGVVGINGTVAFSTVATGSIRAGAPRRNISSAAGAGSTAAYKSSGALVWRGNQARAGGWRFVVYFGTTSAVAQQRGFFGLSASAGIIGNVNPSTLTDIFGVGYDSTETVLSLLHNDNAGGATKTPLGANFPVNGTDWFKLEIIAEPNASSIEYTLYNLTNDTTASGSVNTDLPVSTQFLNAQIWCNNGTTASAVTLEFTTMLLEMRL
jgi:hypothetical protein